MIFTVTFVIIASAVSLQLFCSSQLHHFQTFPQAFMAMFQIITQEGWTEFVVEVLRSMPDRMVPFVAIYFVAYHLFVTLIVLSLFVAVILDNLEMDEELKKVKQLKAKEAITSMRSQLPWRLRVFERFPTRPQMVELRRRRVDGAREFTAPKIRDSFANQFVWDYEEQVPDRWNYPIYAAAGLRSASCWSGGGGSARESQSAAGVAAGLRNRKRPMLTAFSVRHMGESAKKVGLVGGGGDGQK